MKIYHGPGAVTHDEKVDLLRTTALQHHSPSAVQDTKAQTG